MPHPFYSNPLRTREDLENALVSLLDPLAAHTSPGGARIRLGETATHYDDVASQLEGFARPLWGLSSFLAGGGDYPGAERWLNGFANGTDPSHEDFWGHTRGKDQRMVEMAPIGFSLAVASHKFWDPLDQKAKDNFTAWLQGINDKEMPDTNWLWFRVFANLGLSKIGASYSPEQMKKDLDHLDTFYLGDGWSRDGPPGVHQLDYYSGSFAIQYAQLVYSKLAQKEDPIRCEEYRDRARKFAVDFVHYFDEEGRAIPFGRSMTYRFAMSAFWGAVAFADVDLPAPLSWGVIKGLLLRNIRYWTKFPILSPDGVLTIGFTYPSTYFTENYNSPGSPYWAFKAFIPLALPPSHPFWAAEELPYPSSSLPPTVSLHHPGHIITRLGGHTFLLSSKQACHYALRHGAEKYGKFAYSSSFGYSVPTGSIGLDQHNPDSMLALSDDGGERWWVRREVIDPQIELDGEGVQRGIGWLRSSWKPWPDTTVETFLVPPEPETPNWHLRIHRIRTSRKLLSSDGGFSIHGQRADGRAISILSSTSSVLSQGEIGKVEGEGSALASASVGISGVFDLSPSIKRNGLVIPLDANANIMFPRSAMPYLLADLVPQEKDIWLVTGVFALPGAASATSEEAWNTLPKVPEGIKKLMSH